MNPQVGSLSLRYHCATKFLERNPIPKRPAAETLLPPN